MNPECAKLNLLRKKERKWRLGVRKQEGESGEKQRKEACGWAYRWNEALGFIPAPLITGKEGERNTRRERGREGFRVIPSKPHHPVYAVGYLLPSPSYQLC